MTDNHAKRYWFNESCSTLVVGLVLFGCAGDLSWWAAWVVFALIAGTSIAIGLIGALTRPGMLVQRLGPRKGDAHWDVAVYTAIRFGSLASLAVGALDRRWGWTSEVSLEAQTTGLLASFVGLALFVWAVASNRFFSDMVRVQEENGHGVASGGPYRFVRHPGYAGSIVYNLAAPIALASRWALLPAAICAAAFVFRTSLEDRVLQARLTGYADFARRVRFRLLPTIW